MDAPNVIMPSMILRKRWLDQIELSWSKASIVWLSGVRRAGKTTIAKAFANSTYINCDLPSSVELLSDMEAFYKGIGTEIVIFDEVHQIPDPSRLLKIGADVFPHLKILATGSSTLAATRKFRDSLTGRKRNIYLPPVLFEELDLFGVRDVRQRLLKGGLPERLLCPDIDAGYYAEWMDSYYARDVAELFRVEKRSGFLKLMEIILRQSGGLIETESLSKLCGLARPTVMNYLEVLEITHILRKLRPFHGGGRQELVKQPRIYAFDSGFIAFVKGWNDLRSDDCGILWEHLVLDTLISNVVAGQIHYWRDKQGHEIDFVLPCNEGVDIFEAKWKADAFESKNLEVFRSAYPKGRNFVISPQHMPPYERVMGKHTVKFTDPSGLTKLLDS